MDVKTRRRLRRLFALQGSDNQNERESARLRIDEILKKHRLSWTDLVELILNIPDDDPGQAAPTNAGNNIGPLDLVEGMLRRYVHMKDHEYVAAALWVAHTYVYYRFAITPR